MRRRRLFDIQIDKFSFNTVPFSCHLDLTYKCNLNCVHCYIMEEKRPQLKTEEIKNILEQLSEEGTLFLQLSGGEILTRKDFFEIAEYARDLNFALLLTTNGTLIDAEIADKIAELNPHKISISIYSTDPEIHDSITKVPGSLEKSIRAVKLLKERNMRVKISNILMHQNIKDYPLVFELAESLSADFGADFNVTPKINGDSYPIKFQVGTEDLYEIMIDPLLKPKSEEESTFNSANEDFPPEFEEFIEDIPCNAAHSFFYISPYGDVFPCVQFPVSCGNLKEKSFRWIWNRSKEMLKVRNIRMSKIQDCSMCENLKYCNFCPGLAYMEAGNMENPYPRACHEAEIRVKINKMGEKTMNFKN